LTVSIAVAGKGGSGKTSITTLIIRYLIKKGSRPILAIDADPNANLAESLGIEVEQTVGAILDQFQRDKIQIPPGMTKETYLEYMLNQVIVEDENFDLITMGRGEGPECYCYPNLILRKFADKLSGNYSFTVMDNEAGLEHLSRRTTQNIDELLIITNPTVKGVRTVARIKDIVSDLRLSVKRQSIIINSAPLELDAVVVEEMKRLNIKPSVVIPWDDELYQFDIELTPLLDLPDSSKAVLAINDMMAKLLA
jgi:CO dehydrogenase maturation factor